MHLKNKSFPFWCFNKLVGNKVTIYRFVKKSDLDYFANLSLNLYDYGNFPPKHHGGVLFPHKYHRKFAISTMSRMREIQFLSSENQRDLIATILRQDAL